LIISILSFTIIPYFHILWMCVVKVTDRFLFDGLREKLEIDDILKVKQ